MKGGITVKTKKVPMRKCSGCGNMFPKKELVRVVKAPDKKDSDGNIIEKFLLTLLLRNPEEVLMSAKMFSAYKKPERLRGLTVH